MAKRTRTITTAHALRRLERQTGRLLAVAGALSAEYDSARLSEALGHLAQARLALAEAATVREAHERHTGGKGSEQ